jgi:hypothetical protein
MVARSLLGPILADENLTRGLGDPEARISDLRQTRTIMLGGKLLNADELRAAAGFSGRPKAR